MRRRELIIGLGGMAAWPLTTRAQQPALPVVGYLSAARDTSAARSSFLRGLSETGYVDGRNVVVDYRWAEGHYDRLPAMAAELVRRQVAVISAVSTPAAIAAKAATTTIPIVFGIAADPVQVGLVAKLNRPGGNITGYTVLAVEVEPKKLEFLHDVVPTATVIGLLVNPTNANTEIQARNMQAAALTLGVELHVLRASSERDFDTVFANLAQLRAGGLVIASDLFFAGQSEQLATLSLRHAVPTVFQFLQFAAAGGLMSYGGSLTEVDHLNGVYTGRILKGEKPADLPVQQATKIELVINLKTAKALGLTFPLKLLGRADEVIE